MGPFLITGFEGLPPIPVMFTGSLQGRIDLQGVPCKPYRVWVCSAGIRFLLYGLNSYNIHIVWKCSHTFLHTYVLYNLKKIGT